MLLQPALNGCEPLTSTLVLVLRRSGWGLVKMAPLIRLGVAVDVVSRLAETGCYDTVDHEVMELKEVAPVIRSVGRSQPIITVPITGE